jgi:glycerophosphoryl diester phosphodiesterase
MDADLVVAESTMMELKTLDAGVKSGDEWIGTRVPELSEVLLAAPSGRELVLELKVGSEILPVLKQYIKESEVPEDDLGVISCNDSVFSAKDFLPAAKCYFLESDSEKLAASIAKSAEAGIEGLDLHWSLIDDSVMDSAKSAGLDVYVWTVDDADVALRMMKFGVSGLTTNKPAEMMAALGG